MQVKSIVECSKGSILQYFRPSLSYQFYIKTFILSIYKWPLKTAFTVHQYLIMIALSDYDASDLHGKTHYLQVCYKLSQILISYLTSDSSVAVMSVSDHDVSVPS